MKFPQHSFEGAGQPLFALHGFGGFALDFAPLAAVLKRPINALQLPFRERGVDYSTETLVRRLHASIDAASIVMGYSMGARLVLQWATSDVKPKPKGLILVSGTAGLRGEELRQKRREGDLALIERITTDGVAPFFDWWAQLPIIESQHRIAEPYQSQMRHRKQQYDATVLADSLRYFGQGTMPSAWEALHNITCPVLLLVGAEDEKYGEIASELMRALPKAELSVIPNAGHCPHLERPEAVAQQIHRWFDRQGF